MMVEERYTTGVSSSAIIRSLQVHDPKFHTWEDLPLGRAIAVELVRDEHPRDVSSPLSPVMSQAS
jgi:hypothetical protein